MKVEKGKLLIVRFSSIGDIVLTTPVIRSAFQAGWEVHFLTKKSFASVLHTSPYLTKIHIWEETSLSLLRKEKFRFIADLHNNIRSRSLRVKLGIRGASFPKLTFAKLLLVHFKINRMPAAHIVDRYFCAVKKLGLHNDHQGLDFFIPENTSLPTSTDAPYIALVLGAAHATKQIPENKLDEIIQSSSHPILLVGGPSEQDLGERWALRHAHAENFCGKTTLLESAKIIKHSMVVITPDTGMMHIAAALDKPIHSVWGNTTPLFGMYPYYGKNTVAASKSRIWENTTLACRPCSKIGYSSCPKSHFKCMLDQNLADIHQNISS